VSDKNGWQKTIDAPDGYFTAHAGEVTIDGDDAADIRELFKLAPYQKLRLFGVVGGKPGWYDVLRSELTALLGEGNFSLTHDKEANKVTVGISYESSPAQIADVELLMGRVIPQNIVGELLWIDGLPIDYTHVEYLEGDSKAYIDSEVLPTDETEIRAVFYFTPSSYGETQTVASGRTFGLKIASSTFVRWGSEKSKLIGNLYIPRFKGELVFRRGYASYGDKQVTFDCDSFAENPAKYSVLINAKSALQSDGSAINRWYDCRVYENGTEKRAYIPALDPTGTPCMFDLVSKKPFYNSGTGDFIAGVETQKQLDDVLGGLPDRTGQDGGELYLRLPDALYESAVASGIIEATATSKNWQIAYDPTTEMAA
jgi:hypothetical protein